MVPPRPSSRSTWSSSSRACRPGELGRDVFARVVFGARVSLGIGFAAVFIASLVGTAVGITSGFLGGWVDEVVMRIVDARRSR